VDHSLGDYIAEIEVALEEFLVSVSVARRQEFPKCALLVKRYHPSIELLSTPAKVMLRNVLV
jgi:hypothetical protein